MFENIVGNEKNKKTLRKTIEDGKIGQSYMFIGQKGIGKLLFAKEFAKAILCSNQNGCNKCKSCINFNNNNNSDFILIEKLEDKNEIIIDQIRELNLSIAEKPIISNKKVYIINNSELMNSAAQNALLKTLEEPPEYATIILVTSREDLFLNTIKSRCTKIFFNNLSNEELKKILKEKCNYEKISKSMFILFDGSVEKAISLKKREKDFEELNNKINNLSNYNILEILNLKSNIFRKKEEALETLEYINLLFFNMIKQNNKYIECVQAVEKAKEKLKKNNNYDMTIDNFLLTIGEELDD